MCNCRRNQYHVTTCVILVEIGSIKCGSPYFRRAIWQAAFVANNHDPALSLHYQRLCKLGKAHDTAVGTIERKLTHIIFVILGDKKPYSQEHSLIQTKN